MTIPKRPMRRGALVGAVCVAAVVAVFAGYATFRRVAGAFERDPLQIRAPLSPEAAALVARAYDGIDPARLFDYHVHLVGLGTAGAGTWVNPTMMDPWSPLRWLKFQVYLDAAGVRDRDHVDEQYVDRILGLARATPGFGRLGFLAFDYARDAAGNPDLAHSEFFTPNDRVLALAQRYPAEVVAIASIHPRRPDALRELERVHRQGVQIIKWLPNAMNIDPADPSNDPFYDAMAQRGMILLTHAGEERAVEAEEAQELGNPLRLRRPLERGMQVIVAHVASLGDNEDLDHPGQRAASFELFMRLFDDPRWRGLLFGELSAVVQFHRLPGPLATLLDRTDLHPRLVNGSDYPLPAINIVVQTRALEQHGFITAEEREALNEVYERNPLLFDFVLKRTVRSPDHGRRFPVECFYQSVGGRAEAPRR